MTTIIKDSDENLIIELSEGVGKPGVLLGTNSGCDMLANVRVLGGGKRGHEVAPFVRPESAFVTLFDILSRWQRTYVISPDNPGPIIIKTGHGDSDFVKLIWVSSAD